MRVWLITVGEPLPLPGVVDRPWRTGLLAQLLVRRGHDVVWWTSTVDHFTKRYFVEKDCEIRVQERLLLRFLHGRLYKRNVSFSRLANHREIGAQFRRQIEQADRPDVIVCSFPTIELSVEAVRYGRRHGIPVLLDIRDLWPDIFLDVMPKRLRSLGRLLMRRSFAEAQEALRGAKGLIGVSKRYLEWGLMKAGRTATALDQVFPLGYQMSEFNKSDEESLNDLLDSVRMQRGVPLAVFVGTFGRTYDLDTVIRAARILEKEDVKVHFVLCGRGEHEDKWRNAARDLSNVSFSGWLNAGQLACLLQRADIGLAAYAPAAPQGIPNKVIEYMAAGIPLVSSLEGESAQIIADERCGLHYRARDEQELVVALRKLLASCELRKQMGAAARTVFSRTFSADAVYGAMAEHVEQVASSTMVSKTA
ncbi:MAG TPA: glycosyltransferase family 4 protein [Steroidobacteraceae bacterium]|nr:glycosyltransferase family 4 protein [Steroidobacteraceae bacterium]